jgi:hypothetical protein
METKYYVAAATVTGLCLATGGCIVGALAAMETASKAAVLAYGVLGLVSAGASTAAITALFDKNSTDSIQYLKRVGVHSCVSIPGYLKLAIGSVGSALLQGFNVGAFESGKEFGASFWGKKEQKKA